jgi:hypothetical protein
MSEAGEGVHLCSNHKPTERPFALHSSNPVQLLRTNSKHPGQRNPLPLGRDAVCTILRIGEEIHCGGRTATPEGCQV